jgi:hypothetical protein
MIKNYLWVGGLMLFSLKSALGFALLGPLYQGSYNGVTFTNDTWQVPDLGYGLAYQGFLEPGGPVWLGDVGGPMNYQEEYRRNVPVLYYAYDDSFSGVTGDGWFGQAGENAVDQAFAIMNSLNSVDSYSSDLHEFPFSSQSFNYKAQNLYLTDLKSVTLHLLVEQLGLAEPERFTWTLHDRWQSGPLPCPENTSYLVVERNFDVVPSSLNQLQYSPYVNNVLYTYFIEDNCTPVFTPNGWTAITVPRPQDAKDEIYTAVAANNFAGGTDAQNQLNAALIYIGGLRIGGFYTGLTRDDVGGLRYLMSTNNINYEEPAGGSVLTGSTTIGVTNLSPPFLLFTSNYNAFWWSARTNSPTTLSNLYPGLVVLNSSYYFTNIATPNVISYYTNQIGAPAGSPQVLVVRTNGYTYTYLAIYSDTFANVVIVTNGYSPGTSAQLVTVSVGLPTGSPAGSPLVTNTTTQTITVSGTPSGEFYINTNYLCGPDIIISTLGTNVTATTNLLYATSNSAGFFTSQSLVVYSTTHVYVVEQPICTSVAVGGTATNIPEYYQGIGGVRFVKVPDGLMDPLTRQLTTPITSRYTNYVFNPATRLLETRIFQRVLNTPDIIISAADLAVGPSGDLFVGTVDRTPPGFEFANVLPGLAGPGIIDNAAGPTIFTYNKVGPIFWNGMGELLAEALSTNGFLDLVSEYTQMPALQWASFDNSTNDPVMYPNGTSIQQIEDSLAISITPTSLPDGYNGTAYAATTFSATGGAPPYTWSLGPDTPLPYGLTFPTVTSATDVLSGTPSGNVPGVYDFTIQVSDSQGRVVDLNYTITIH